MGCTICCISLMSFLICVDIYYMHSCKRTEMKCHIPSTFLFKLFFLILPSDLCSVI